LDIATVIEKETEKERTTPKPTSKNKKKLLSRQNSRRHKQISRLSLFF